MSTIQLDNRVTVGPMPAGASGIALQDAAEFIWWEAELLDRHDYKSWLASWTEQGRYIIPIERKDGADYLDALNVVYDDAEMRKARVRRLRSGFAMSSAPAARTARTVSRFVRTGETADALELRAAQHLVEYKFERTRILAADVTYHLVRTETGIRLDRKEVLLLNSDDYLWGIGYLL